jgi:hypothetical protein
MSRSNDVDDRQIRTALWRVIIQRFATLTMLAVAMEWATPMVRSDILAGAAGCAAPPPPCYEVRATAPQAPPEGSGRTSSTSCTSR